MVKIKICGITRPEDVDAVNAAMPDYIGFVFAKESRRFVEPKQALELRRGLNNGIIPVGVFVNAPLVLIRKVFSKGTIEIAQLHGGESAEYTAALKACGIPIIQALRDGRGDTPSELADYYLFDGADGGSGSAFDWSKIPSAGKPMFLAGGIREDNIKAALALKPFAVDVSSGAETDGLKDGEKISYLVRLVRGGV